MSYLHTREINKPVKLCNLPTLRQAFIAASSIIIAGYLLEYFVHPAFHWLPLLVAGGLLFAGVVGFCPMVYFIQKLPWNRKS